MIKELKNALLLASNKANINPPEVIEKAILAASNLTKGLSQEELEKLWPVAKKVSSLPEVFGEWVNEKSTKGFMEIVIKLKPDGTGTFFNSVRADNGEWPLNYSIEESVLTLALEAIDSDGVRYKHVDARLFGNKLLLNDNGAIVVYVLSNTPDV